MAFHVRDKETDALVRTLAGRHRIGLTEAIRRAVSHELRREEEAIPLKDRIAALRAEISRRPATGLAADKAFFDDLSGDL
jgi:antitoxin VapB